MSKRTLVMSTVVLMGALPGCESTDDARPEVVVGRVRFVAATPIEVRTTADQGGRRLGSVTTNTDGNPRVTDEYEMPPLHDISEAELAEALRARGGIGGTTVELMAAEPDFASARLIRSKDATVHHPRPAAVVSPGPAFDTGVTAQNIMGGVDNRSRSTDAHGNRVVWIQRSHNSVDIRSCSGTYIGPRTLITAAHCVREGGLNWGNYMSFTPGAYDGIPVFGTHQNCYYWWYPTAWATSGETDYRYDFAVINFDTCSTKIPTVGYSLITINGEFGIASISGYPTADTTPPGTAYASNVKHWGSIFLDDFRWQTDVIDATKGQSGGPWRNDLERVIAIHTGYRTYYNPFFQRANFGRRLDNAVWAFIQAYSVDY